MGFFNFSNKCFSRVPCSLTHTVWPIHAKRAMGTCVKLFTIISLIFFRRSGKVIEVSSYLAKQLVTLGVNTQPLWVWISVLQKSSNENLSPAVRICFYRGRPFRLNPIKMAFNIFLMYCGHRLRRRCLKLLKQSDNWVICSHEPVYKVGHSWAFTIALYCLQ